MKICVYGAGAIGGLIAARLHQAGADPLLIARGATLAAVRRDGLVVHRDGDTLRAQPRCTDDPATAGPQDVVIAAVKAYAVADVATAMAPLLGPETAVVMAMNGIPWWYTYRCPPTVDGRSLEDRHLDSVDPGGRIWRAIGPARAIGCVVYPAAEIEAPGVIRHISLDRLILGEPDGRDTPRLQAIADVLRSAAFAAETTDAIRTAVWEKLWGNAPTNPLSVIHEATADRLATDPETRAEIAAVMAEIQAVTHRLGIALTMDIDERITAITKLVGFKTSMLQDYERGRPLELDGLLGAVAEIGRLVGVPTPASDAIYDQATQKLAAAAQARA